MTSHISSRLGTSAGMSRGELLLKTAGVELGISLLALKALSLLGLVRATPLPCFVLFLCAFLSFGSTAVLTVGSPMRKLFGYV